MRKSLIYCLYQAHQALFDFCGRYHAIRTTYLCLIDAVYGMLGHLTVRVDYHRQSHSEGTTAIATADHREDTFFTHQSTRHASYDTDDPTCGRYHTSAVVSSRHEQKRQREAAEPV